ncbi:histidine kinase [Blastococcus sp. CT_GayMR16]|uniref:sensor histidine kinase n=1 Tax=Blastococcus sp. CT_GayMR16 TaxID=2559607 RepID=UPI0010730993|nr:histidine kinase [Blastococcus sp. CT_GayMR16]TFV89632.1 sensor histidine kinase [Blastococcus sp. CT_GayMR16]
MATWPQVRRIVDPLLAAALLGAGQYAVWALPSAESGFVAPPWVDALFLVPVCVPVAWRTRRPVAVFAVVLGSTWLWLLLLYGDQPQPPFVPAVALWLSTFSAAAVPRSRTAWGVGAGLAAFLVSTDVPALLDGRPWSNVLPSWVVFALTFAVGRVVGLRQQQAAAAAERAARSEAGREEEARRAAVTERTRIARELHDVVTHAVTVMVVQAAAEARTLPSGSATRGVLHDIETTGREALVELRRMLGVLRKEDGAGDRSPQPSLRELDGLLGAARSGGLDVRLEVRGRPAALPAALDLSVYRIVQEALTNVRKHGSPGPAELRLSYCPDALVVEVVNPARDHGAPDTPGHGLVGLRERVDLHGGTLEAGPEPDGEFRLRARLPYAGVVR